MLYPREVKSGKEATVFIVSWKNNNLALKVYIDPKYRSFQTTENYLAGRHFRKPSERKAVLKKAKFGKRLAHRIWVNREFYLLQNAKNAGATVPEVYAFTSDTILMQFIGDDNRPAPRLIDAGLTKEQAEKAFMSLLKDIDIFLSTGFVHSDLSAYNILFWRNVPYIIDLPQAVDIRTNPNKEQLLKKDIDNLITFFSKFISINANSVYANFNMSVS